MSHTPIENENYADSLWSGDFVEFSSQKHNYYVCVCVCTVEPLNNGHIGTEQL